LKQTLSAKEAMKVATKCINHFEAGNMEEFWQTLNPILTSKTSFPQLDRIGLAFGKSAKSAPLKYIELFDEIQKDNRMGGYVIIGKALSVLLDIDLQLCLLKAREYLIKGDRWYVCDILGERVYGQALLRNFEETLPHLERFSRDQNRWVKRSVGVAVHSFVKRTHNDKERIKRLLELLSLQIEEKDTSAIKGIGWGLKTIGKYQPQLLEKYLRITLESKRMSKLMLRKAATYLKPDVKEELSKLRNKRTEL